jgi:hypothetical protein
MSATKFAVDVSRAKSQPRTIDMGLRKEANAFNEITISFTWFRLQEPDAFFGI